MKDLNFSYFKKIKKFFFALLLKYKIQKWTYFFLFLILFYQSLNILSNNNFISLKSKSDFEDYFNAAIRLKDFKNPYYTEKIHKLLVPEKEIKNIEDLQELLENTKGVGTYLYPPIYAFLLIPLTFFSYNVASVIYQIIQLFLLIISLYLFYLISKQLFPSLSKRRIHFIILISLISLFPLQIQNISNGNVGFLIIFFVTLSLFLFFKSNNNSLYDFLNGIIIGIAFSIKVIPAFLVGYYFIKKKYKVIFGSIIGIILGIFIPSLYLGWENNLNFFKNWYELIILNYQKYSTIRPYANNQTISGALSKLFIPYSDFKQHIYGLPFSLFLTNLSTVSIIIRFINMFLIINLGIITLISFFKKINSYTFFLYYFYCLLLTALLTSGISWYHTYSILIINSFFFYLFSFKYSINKTIFLLPPLCIWFLYLLPNKMKDFLSLYSIFTWLNFIIVLYLFILLYKYLLVRGTENEKK